MSRIFTCCFFIFIFSCNVSALKAQSLESIRDSIYYFTSSNNIAQIKNRKDEGSRFEERVQYYLKKVYAEIQNNTVKDEALEVFFLMKYAQNLRENEGKIEEAYAMMQGLYKRFQDKPILKEKAKDTYGELLARLGYLEFYINGNFDLAEQLYLEALDKYIPQDSLYSYSSLLINLSHLTRYKNNFTQARDYALKVQELRKPYGLEHYIYISSLNVLATVYEYFEQYDIAEEYYKEGIRLLKKNPPEKITTKSYEDMYSQLQHNLGGLYIYLGRYSEARNYIEQVKLYDERIGLAQGNLHINLDYATTCLNLALIYNAEQNYTKAKEYLNKCLEIEKRVLGEKSLEYARSLRSLGDIYRSEGNYSQSLLTFKKVRGLYESKLSKSYNDNKEYLSTLKGEALLYQKWELYEKSLETFKRLLALQDNINNKGSQLHISSLQHVANAYALVKNYTAAYEFLEESIRLNAKDSIQTINWSNLSEIDWRYPLSAMTSLQIYVSTKKQEFTDNNKINLDTAYIAIKQAILINKKVRNNLWSDNDKLKILEETYKLTNLALTIAAMKNEDYHTDAFIFIENNKGALLSEGIRSQQANKFLPKELSDKETELTANYSKISRQLLASISLQEDEYHQQQLVEIQAQITALKARLEQEYPKYYQWKYGINEVNLATIQAALKPTELLIEYFIGEDDLFILAASKEKVKVYNLPLSSEKVTNQLINFKKNLTRFDLVQDRPEKAYNDYTQGAYLFYTSFLKNAIEDFKTQTELIIIPDGQLGLIPFEIALKSPAPTNALAYKNLDYLLKTHSIAYHYSANLWLEHRMQSQKQVARQAKILGMAGNYTGKNQFLSPLSAVNIELQAINNIYKGNFIIDQQTSEEFFKKQASEYDIIHLAMHGLGNEKTPILSSLHFTDYQGEIEDNVLEAWEIMQIPIKAKLVTLSACESGVGVYLRGDGVSSLARAFMYSGASSLLVSLWKVHDQATAAIMQFYYSALAQGLDKASALRQAKLRYLETYGDEILHPAYWAAFVQIGDIENIKPLSNNNIFYIGSMALIIIIGAILYFKKRKVVTA